LMLICLVSTAHSAVVTWKVGAVGLWTNPDNWDSGVPGPEDSVVIDGAGSVADIKSNVVALHVSVLAVLTISE